MWTSFSKNGPAYQRWLSLLEKVGVDAVTSRIVIETDFSVAQMTKVKGWHDIRLLSFDLQTVEFAYAQVSFRIALIDL